MRRGGHGPPPCPRPVQELAGVGTHVPDIEVVAALRVSYLEVEGDAPRCGKLSHADMVEDTDEALLAGARIGDRNVADQRRPQEGRHLTER